MVCWLLCVECCVGVCRCLLFVVVRCAWFVVRCLFVCCLLFVLPSLWFVVRRLLLLVAVVFCWLCGARCSLIVARCVVCVACLSCGVNRVLFVCLLSVVCLVLLSTVSYSFLVVRCVVFVVRCYVLMCCRCLLLAVNCLLFVVCCLFMCVAWWFSCIVVCLVRDVCRCV